MEDQFTRRVCAAARAGWWTILLAAAFLTVQWLAYLCFMRTRPAWLLDLWFGGAGANASWGTVQTMWLWMTAIFKLCVWVLTLTVLWLSLWARRLRKVG